MGFPWFATLVRQQFPGLHLLWNRFKLTMAKLSQLVKVVVFVQHIRLRPLTCLLQKLRPVFPSTTTTPPVMLFHRPMIAHAFNNGNSPELRTAKRFACDGPLEITFAADRTIEHGVTKTDNNIFRRINRTVFRRIIAMRRRSCPSYIIIAFAFEFLC